MATGLAGAGSLAVFDCFTRTLEAAEQIKILGPLSHEWYTVPIKELSNEKSLRDGSSDLADLDRATNGTIGKQIIKAIHSPLPISKVQFEKGSESELQQQVLIMLSQFGQLEGLNTNNLSADVLNKAVEEASKGGTISLYTLIKALPGKTVSIDIPKIIGLINQNARLRAKSEQIVKRSVSVTADSALALPGRYKVEQRDLQLNVSHRPRPLHIVLVQPKEKGNGRLVIISHGLWDSPANFLGWATHLANHGYTVLLPDHPGSNQEQQRDMLEGDGPPPSAEELLLRPLDISAAINAVESKYWREIQGVKADSTVVIGHSWGGITALQLAGAQSNSKKLKAKCGNFKHAYRTISWILQCSFQNQVDRPNQRDQRVKSVVAISPPIGLLFNEQAAKAMRARVLLISGTRDVVVPADPEALYPYSHSPENGHRLVLVDGGTHFNLRAPEQGKDKTILSPLILAWVNGTFSSGSQYKPKPGAPSLLPKKGWGNKTMKLVDVTNQQAKDVIK
jgi:predicted dienelactone hydrolase